MWFRKHILLAIAFAIVWFNGFAQNTDKGEGGYNLQGRITDQAGNAIVGCTVAAYNSTNQNEFKAASSDGEGNFLIERLPKMDWHLSITMIGYKTYTKDVSLSADLDLGIIVLKDDIESLDKVVITAEMVKQFGDRREFTLSNADKRQYSSALKALEFLPKIIIADQNVSSMDGKVVKILINGVPSDSKDLSVISPEMIQKIIYYDHPPVQYSNMGLGSVINIILRHRATGGGVGINTLNAVTTGFGGNTLGLKYNFGNSRIGLTYDMRYRNFSKRNVDEILDYSVAGLTYHKEKTGLEGLFRMIENLGELSFDNARANNYLFSAKIGMKALDYVNSSVQDVTTNTTDAVFKGNSRDDNDYLRPSADLFFSKTFAEKHNVTLNVVGTYYSTKYDYNYREMTSDVTNFCTATSIETDKYSIITDAVYSLRLGKSQFTSGLRYNWNENKQRYMTSGNRTETRDLYAYSGLTGMLGKKVSYNATLGVNNDIFTTVSGDSYSFTYFRPSIRLGYLISRSSQLTFRYEVNTQTPSVSELTYNPYYKDESYMYVGNPNLRPANTHDLNLTFFKGFTKSVVNATAEYIYSNDAIAPVFEDGVTNIVESFDNIDYSQTLRGSLFLQWIPWNSNILRLRLQTQVTHTVNSHNGNKWKHTSVMLIPMATVSYKNYSLEVFYQSPRKKLSGNLLNYESSMARCELTYKPVKDLTVGVAIRYPFYKYWNGYQKVVGTTLLDRKETERIYNHSNMIYLTLVYNFSFGSKGIKADRKVKNEDTDSGVLGRVRP